MAKVRIVYQVDDQELKALDKELKGIQKENKKVEDGFKGSNEEIKKSKTSLVDLKGAVASVGLVALATGAIVEFAKLNAEIAKNRKEVALLTKATGLALDNITAKLRATSKVFNKDFNEILRAANTVSKEFGVSMTEALDEINEGFTRGLDINGEYLETLKEYSTFIKEAGLNTRQFNVLIQQQAQQGIFSDKGIDAIKEAVLSIREMTPATRDAIRGVGIDTNKMTADIQSGVKTYFEAVQEIATKTRELADPVKTGTILADVFRGAGEDAGNFIFTLDQIGDEFAKVTEEEQKYIDAQNQLIKATTETEKSLLKLTSSTQSLGISLATFWENVKSGTIGGLNDLINAFTSADTQIENFRRSVAGVDKESLQGAINDLTESLEENREKLQKQQTSFAASAAEASVTAKKIGVLEQQLATATQKMVELEQAEIDEAAAAEKAKIEADELAKAKGLQVEASKKAREESEAVAKALEKETEARRKANEAFTTQSQGPILKKQRDDVREAAKEQQDLNDETTEKYIEGIDEQIRKRAEQTEREKEQQQIEANQQAEAEAQKQEMIEFGIMGIMDIQSRFLDLRLQQINQELQANELARNRELEHAEGNKALELEINERFDEKQNELRREQAIKERNSALFKIAIDTAVNAVKGFPGLTAFAIALGAIQAGLVVAAPLNFAEGVLRLKGPGTKTSDSIPANLSAGETVLTAGITDDYFPAIKAIHNREISPEIMNNIAMHRDTQPIVINDYDKLARAVMAQPQKNLIADENGLTGYFLTQGKSLVKKQAKYRM